MGVGDRDSRDTTSGGELGEESEVEGSAESFATEVVGFSHHCWIMAMSAGFTWGSMVLVRWGWFG